MSICTNTPGWRNLTLTWLALGNQLVSRGICIWIQYNYISTLNVPYKSYISHPLMFYHNPDDPSAHCWGPLQSSTASHYAAVQRRIQFVCYCSKEASKPLVGRLMISFIENMKEWSQQNERIARKLVINPGSWKFLKSKVNWRVQSTTCPQSCNVVSVWGLVVDFTLNWKVMLKHENQRKKKLTYGTLRQRKHSWHQWCVIGTSHDVASRVPTS